MTRSLVIVHPGSLGDVLVAVPAMRRLQARYPGRDTLLIAHDSISRLLVACGIVNASMSWDGPGGAGLFSRGAPLPGELTTWLNRCDAAVAWLDGYKDTLRATFREFHIARVWIQSPSSPVLRAKHQSDRFLEIVEESAGDGLSERFVQVSPGIVEAGSACLERIGIPRGRPFVLVHPGSGSAHKCLNPTTIAGIVQRLDQQGLLPVIIEGPADQHAVERVLQAINSRPPILRNLDLPTLGGVLVQSQCLLGHDSGVTHLAALLGVRTVAVFGPTDPARWAPLGDHVTIVRGPSCHCPSWGDVQACHEKPCLAVPVDQIFTSLEAAGLT